MMQYGEPPFLECSTEGDKRFSAFCAIVNGNSIEEQYQVAKIFDDGSTGFHWKEAKGRRAANAAECAILYEKLWRQFRVYHQDLLLLRYGQTLQKRFRYIQCYRKLV